MKGTTQRLKLMLLSGKKLTVAELEDIFETNNAPQIVNRLRKTGFTVDMEMKKNKKKNKVYGEYSHTEKAKVNRISRVLEKH